MSDHTAIADDKWAAQIGAVTDDTLRPDDAGALDEYAGFDDCSGANRDEFRPLEEDS